MIRAPFSLMALLSSTALALAANPVEHFGGVTIDTPLAVASGGLGNGTGDGSALSVLSGSMARTLAARFSEVVDAADYGVVCDYIAGAGGTDNTAALAAAIAAAQTASQFGGRKLVLPAGRCLSGPQTITGQIAIEGQGTFVSQLVLKSGSTAPMLTFAPTYSPDFSTASDALTFGRKFGITSVDGYGAWSASNDASGIKIAAVGSTWFFFDDINVLDMPNNGIEGASSTGSISLRNPVLNWNGGWGLKTNTLSDTAVRGAQIYMNGYGANSPGIPAAGGGWISAGDPAVYVEDMNSFYNNGPGVWFYGPYNVTIAGHNEFNGNVAQGVFISSTTAASQLTFDAIGFGGNSRLSPGTYADLEIYNGTGGKLVLNGDDFPANHAAGGGSSGYNVQIDSGATMTAECHSCFIAAGGPTTAAVTNNSALFSAFGGDGGTLTGAVNIVTASQYRGLTIGNGANLSVILQGTTSTNDSGELALQLGGVAQIKLSAGNGISSYAIPNVGFGGETSPSYPVDVLGTVNATTVQATNGVFQSLRVSSLTQYGAQTWGNGAYNFAVLGGSTPSNDAGFFALQIGGVPKVYLSAGNGVQDYFVPDVGFGGQTAPAYPVDVTGAIHATAAPLFDALTGFVKCNGTTGACSASATIPSSAVSGLGSAAAQASTAFDVSGAASAAQTASLQKTGNLADLSNAATARTNLGLGALSTYSSLPLASLSGLGPGVASALAIAAGVTGGFAAMGPNSWLGSQYIAGVGSAAPLTVLEQIGAATGGQFIGAGSAASLSSQPLWVTFTDYSTAHSIALDVQAVNSAGVLKDQAATINPGFQWWDAGHEETDIDFVGYVNGVRTVMFAMTAGCIPSYNNNGNGVACPLSNQPSAFIGGSDGAYELGTPLYRWWNGFFSGVVEPSLIVYANAHPTVTPSAGCTIGAWTGGAGAGEFVATSNCSGTYTLTLPAGISGNSGLFCPGMDTSRPLPSSGFYVVPSERSATTVTYSVNVLSGDLIQLGCLGY